MTSVVALIPLGLERRREASEAFPGSTSVTCTGMTLQTDYPGRHDVMRGTSLLPSVLRSRTSIHRSYARLGLFLWTSVPRITPAFTAGQRSWSYTSNTAARWLVQQLRDHHVLRSNGRSCHFPPASCTTWSKLISPVCAMSSICDGRRTVAFFAVQHVHLRSTA
jgi:hypothetical protein